SAGHPDVRADGVGGQVRVAPERVLTVVRPGLDDAVAHDRVLHPDAVPVDEPERKDGERRVVAPALRGDLYDRVPDRVVGVVIGHGLDDNEIGGSGSSGCLDSPCHGILLSYFNTTRIQRSWVS